MKALGYKKGNRTFSKDAGDYWERFHFQGSTSNGLYADWKFYINVGIEFKDLPETRSWSYFDHTHWASRLETLVPIAPPHWIYNQNTNPEKLMKELLPLFISASNELRKDCDTIRNLYLNGKSY